MKKKNMVKTASIVALSAVMLCGTAVSFGCGGTTSSYELSVYIFCSDNDAVTNEQICRTWAEEYTESQRAAGAIPADTTVTVDFNYQPDTTTYNNTLNQNFTDGTAADVIYLSPRNVSVWRARGRVLDISDYIDPADADLVNGIWEDSLAFYGYTDDENYTRGERITFQADGPNGQGFYTASGVEVGLYGLPKDYSNFTMAFNGKFFTEQMKTWMTSYSPTQSRNVRGAANDTASLTFTGESGTTSITYAVSGEYTNPYTGETIDAVANQPAPFIAVGVPLVYKPFNFYRFTSYDNALAGGDPVALSVDLYTNGEGYVVTIPGFPGETFDVPESVTTDANAEYRTELGHITLTYAEFGALTWATTYFCNTFNYWDAVNGSGESALLSGTGGLINESSLRANIYGNGQYEGAPNPTLYTLPWLYGNDSDFINSASTYATNPDVTTERAQFTSVDAMKNAVASQSAEVRQKMSLDGEMRDVNVYYGVNSYNFLEFYGAFLEYSSTWNGLTENCGDTYTTSDDNAWATFRAGNTIFYGGGTWDAQARNDSEVLVYCEFHTMPQAVAEKYALYSFVKDGFYETRTYAWVSQEENAEGLTIQNFWNGSRVTNDNDATRINGSDANTSGGDYRNDSYCKIFTEDDIIANQVIRQDKWGARMDSVGYAVNGTILNNPRYDNNDWRAAAAASLVQALSVNEEAQVELCLGGAQLPNFRQQCVEFLNYQDDEYETEGSFSMMITPEGYSTTNYYNEDGSINPDGQAEAEEIWKYYYGIVNAMNLAASGSSETRTVREFMDDYIAANPAPAAVGEVRWNHDYDDRPLIGSTNAALTIGLSYRASAMKVLNMQTYTLADRDLNMRMQYGLNSARDPAMYTYQTTWLNDIRIGSAGLAYSKQQTLAEGTALQDIILTYASGTLEGSLVYMTPAVHCLQMSATVAQHLRESIDAEEYEIMTNSI